MNKYRKAVVGRKFKPVFYQVVEEVDVEVPKLNIEALASCGVNSGLFFDLEITAFPRANPRTGRQQRALANLGYL